MKKIKKNAVLIFAFIMGICSIAYSFSGDSDVVTQRYAWPLATCSTTDTITHIFATAFAEQVEQMSRGKMKIQVYPQSSLGGDRELMESCKDGDIPFVLQSPAPQVTFMPELCVLDTPCVFSTIEQARAAIDGQDFNMLIKEVYSDAGYQLLGVADQGFRVMTTQTKFTGFDSFKGQKIRTMENAYHIQFWKAMKANPTPMSFSEVYIALQQGTIDAQENAYEIIVSAKLYEQQKYVIETNAVPDFTTLIVSDKFYKELSQEQRDIIDKASAVAQEQARAAADDRIAARKLELTEAGLEFIDLGEETWSKMQQSSQPVYDAIRKQVGDELADLYIGTYK
jgi:tripartite ATP-independent transporter DctP family solute receptor